MVEALLRTMQALRLRLNHHHPLYYPASHSIHPDLRDSLPQSSLPNLMYLHVAESPLRAVKVECSSAVHCILESCGVCSGGDGTFC
jgi:hypothetical protein